MALRSNKKNNENFPVKIPAEDAHWETYFMYVFLCMGGFKNIKEDANI